MSALLTDTETREAVTRGRRRIAVLVVVLLLAGFVGTNLNASFAQRGLEDRWELTVKRFDGASPAELARWTPLPGEPVARMRIPALGLDAIVVEDATPAQMRRGPAHLTGTPLPGESGTAAITANRLGFGGHFADLDELDAGDLILLEWIGGERVYTVMQTATVPADRIDLNARSERPALLLFASARRWGGGDRFTVRAVEEGQ